MYLKKKQHDDVVCHFLDMGLNDLHIITFCFYSRYTVSQVFFGNRVVSETNLKVYGSRQ